MTERTWITDYWWNISTHILTKRMTSKLIQDVTKELFQLTSSRRGWQNRERFQTHYLLFQLTSSRRGWLVANYGEMEKNTFQLTSSRRGWRYLLGMFVIVFVFQLTSSRRGWQRWISRIWLPEHFNSHPHEEDDKVKKLELEQNHISTHILTKRMTGFNNYFCIRIVFQLTSSRRGWR